MFKQNTITGIRPGPAARGTRHKHFEARHRYRYVTMLSN